MIKKMLSFMLTLVLIIPHFSAYVSAAERCDVDVIIDGMYQNFAMTPMQEKLASGDKEYFLSAEEIYKIMGITYFYDNAKKVGTAIKDDTALKFTIGKLTALINDKEKKISVAPIVYNSYPMIPVKLAVETFGGKVKYDDKKNTIEITYKGKISILNPNTPVSDKAVELTFDEALDEALKANSTLAQLSESVTYMQQLRKDTQEKYYQAASYGYGYDKNIVSMIRAVAAFDDELTKVPLTEQIIKDTTEYLIRNCLVNIAAYVMDIQSVQELIKLQTRAVSNTKLKLSYGMASENDLKKANLELEQSKTNLGLLNMSLKNEKYSLNKILSRGTEEEIFIKFDPVITHVKVVSIEAYASDKLETDPSVKIKSLSVRQAQYKLDTSYPTLDESKLQLQSELNTAERDLNDSMKELTSLMYSTYNTLAQINEKQKSLEIDLEKAVNNYQNMIVNYQAGLVTLYDLDLLKMSILNSEAAIQKNKHSYWNLAYAFEHPYLLASN